MSIEFVEPTEPTAVVAPTAAAAARRSALPGRLLGVAALLAAVMVGVAARVQLYVVEKTSFVVDFDGTSTQRARVPYDAFGHARTAQVFSDASGAAPGGGGAYSSTLTVSRPDGIAYGPWWLGVAGLLVVLGVWAVLRPRSTRPGGPVAALGGVLLGSLGAAWLTIRTVDAESAPQVAFAARPGPGVWLLVAAGALAVVAGVLHVTRPPVRRLFPARRGGDVQISGVDRG